MEQGGGEERSASLPVMWIAAEKTGMGEFESSSEDLGSDQERNGATMNKIYNRGNNKNKKMRRGEPRRDVWKIGYGRAKATMMVEQVSSDRNKSPGNNIWRTGVGDS
eukprot:754402-Hanusia_phi.AAC.2